MLIDRLLCQVVTPAASLARVLVLRLAPIQLQAWPAVPAWALLVVRRLPVLLLDVGRTPGDLDVQRVLVLVAHDLPVDVLQDFVADQPLGEEVAPPLDVVRDGFA